ncbi:MAG: CxxxxCH/CxxCH domain c-type cytochrome [Bacteroidota bacterium]
MNMRLTYKVSVVLMTTLGISSCADLKSDLPAPTNPGVQIHGEGWINPLAPSFHGNTIRVNNWDMRSCQTCHGVSYSGGTAGSSCLECHTNSAGPENCATCHGSSNPAPPRDLTGMVSPSSRGVGAHQIHLTGGALATDIPCSECHVVPTSTYGSPAHLDNSAGAELTFQGPQGTIVTGGGTRVPHPSYDASTLKCNNTFCHGDFVARRADADSVDRFAYTDTVIVGAQFSPLWTGGSAEAACGTCHGLPPIGHVGPVTVQQCGNSGCHPGIVNANGLISDKTKHMNGRINVRGTERVF